MRFFSLIYQGDVHLSDDQKIVPSEDFSLLLQALDILEKAKEDAITFKKEQEEKIAVLKETAIQEGKQSGLEQFNEKLAWFDRELKALRIELQGQVLPIALKAARKIVATELKTHPEVIVDI